jgi:hypothetical protein
MTANTDFVQSVIGGLSGTFGNAWDSNLSQLVVNDAVEAYGVSVEADATDVVKLHALLRYFTWVRVRDELLLDPNSYSADGESFNFSRERLDKRVQEAFAKASPYLPEGQIEQGRVTYPEDPYSIQGQIQHNA